MLFPETLVLASRRRTLRWVPLTPGFVLGIALAVPALAVQAEAPTRPGGQRASVHSDTGDATTAPTGAPVAPVNLRGVAYSRTSFELFWDRQPGAALRYAVTLDGTLLRETDGISAYFDGLEQNRDYRVDVTTFDREGRRSSPGTVTLRTGSGTAPGSVLVHDANTPSLGPSAPTAPPAHDDVFAAITTDFEPDRSLYQEDGYATADVIRVDLRTATMDGPCVPDDLSGCTLADVIGDTDKTDELKVDIAVHFRADDFADDGTPSNAELRQRGGGSRFAPQKSFRVKLDSKETLWRNERYLQLNKHPFESSRFRNKVAFELMSDVPHLPSFRTQFVNLWIDDGRGAEDYGLFTHIERLNDDWLARRGLPDDGNLYSAEDFRFAASDLADVAIDEDGKPLDKDRFESSLEIEEGKDHTALVAMLRAIQNPDLDFDTVLDRHFNRNNVLAWATVNLLIKQDDATRHNFKLYNPAGTERFYFVPWDYDAVFGEWQEPPAGYSTDALRQRLDYGYALGHRNDFLSRYYRMPGVHRQILAAADVLRQDALSNQRIQEKTDRYNDLVAPFETRTPDAEFNPEFNSYSGRSFAPKVAANHEAIETRFSLPMPPTLLEPVRDGNRLRFRWTPAHEVTGNALTYDLEIATSPDFSDDSIALAITGIADARGTVEQPVDTDQLRPGRHYARLTARAANEPMRYWQVARNRTEVDGSAYLGLIAFEAR